MSDKEDKDFQAVGLNTMPGRRHLTLKTKLAFQYIYEHHLDDADWFLKADDDTYVIVENLRYMLSAQNTSKAVYFGHHFKTLHSDYFSGSGGYVLSKQALIRFGTRPKHLCVRNRGPEDLMFGRCMAELNVTLGDARDRLDNTRFHAFHVGYMLQRTFPDWYLTFDQDNTTKVGVLEMDNLLW